MSTRRTGSQTDVRAIALAAGRQHRAGMRRLERYGAFRPGARRDLHAQFTALCRTCRIARADVEPALRILDLITPGTSRLSVPERAAEVRRLYRQLRRSQSHPMILALAGIAEDSISRAVEILAGRAGATRPRGGRQRYAMTVVGEDVAGFMLGYETGQKLTGNSVSATGLYLGLSGAYHFSRWALDQGLPPF